jgi:hypothetical protein
VRLGNWSGLARKALQRINSVRSVPTSEEHDRYLVLHNEWQGEYRIYGCAMYLDIIAGQVWIQHNSTEIYIDRELIKAGISPQDIVLGFRSPSIRQRLAAALYGT